MTTNGGKAPLDARQRYVAMMREIAYHLDRARDLVDAAHDLAALHQNLCSRNDRGCLRRASGNLRQMRDAASAIAEIDSRHGKVTS